MKKLKQWDEARRAVAGSSTGSASSRSVFAACIVLLAAGSAQAQTPASPATAEPAPQAAPQRPPRIPKPGVPAIKRDIADLQPTATIYPVEGSPDWSVITPEAAWVASARANHVVQLLPATAPGPGKVGLVVDVNRPCSGLSAGFGSIWTPSCADKKLLRLDPKTGTVQAAIDAEPENSEGGIWAGPDAVWMVVKPNTLIRVDPKTNTIAARIELPATAANPVVGGSYVWVSTFTNNSVVQVDPRTNTVVATIPTGPKPRFITFGAGSVWTLNQGDGTVTRIDAKTAKIVATIACGIPGGGGDLSFADGYVWATLFEFPLTQIDPATNQPIHQWAGPGGDGMRVGGGAVWLSNLRQQTVWRLPDNIK